MIDKISKWLIYLAYYLDDNKKYKEVKKFFYNLLNNQKFKGKLYFDFFMIFLVLVSITILIYDVKHPLDETFYNFEYFILTVFLIEYIARVWVYNDVRNIIIKYNEDANFLGLNFNLKKVFLQIISKKFEYIMSPLAIIDLLALLPSFRAFRILRIFLLFRLFKLFRYARSINEFMKVLIDKKFEIFTLIFLVGFIVFVSSVAIYVFEGELQESKINTFFDALYWSLVTVSTVGYGDIFPITSEGRFIAIILIISGIAVISFSTSIVASAFSEKLYELKESRLKAEVEKINNYIVICGFGRVGQIMAKKLYEAGDKFVIVDSDRQKIELAKSRNFLALEADAKKSFVLNELGIGSGAKTILCLTNNDMVNIYITLSARSLDKNIKIISRVSSKVSEKKFFLAGANRVIYPFETTALAATEYMGQPVAFEAIHEIVSGTKKVLVEDIEIKEGSFLDNTQVGNINFDKFKVILFGVLRKNNLDLDLGNYFDLSTKHFIFNPKSNFLLKSGDSLIVFGNKLSISHIKVKIEKSILNTKN